MKRKIKRKIKTKKKGRKKAELRSTKSELIKPFSIAVVGYGGQGVLSLAEIIANAAFMQGFDVKQTEMHGLAQRFGALQCCVRLGKKVHSPLISKENADLIIALDALEAARAVFTWNFSSKNKTVILTNAIALNPEPFGEAINVKALMKEMRKRAKIVKAIDASKITEELIGETAMSNIFILGYAIKHKFLPLKKEIVWKAIIKRLRPEFLEKNKKVFNEAFKF